MNQENNFNLPEGAKIIYDPQNPVPTKQSLNEFPKGSKIVEPSKPEFSEEEEPDLDKEIERNIAQQTSRGLERLIGMPGDLANLFQQFTGLGMKDIPLSEEESKEAGVETGEAFKREPIKTLPTSHDLRQFSEKITGGYTKPKTEFEEKAGEFVGDVAGRSFPFGLSNNFVRLAVPAIGHLTKYALEKGGAKEENSRKSKMLMEIMLDLSTGNGRQFANNILRDARQAGRGLSINSSPIQHELTNLRNTWRTSLRGRSINNAAVGIANDLERAITNGRLNANSLLDARIRINDARAGLGHFTALPTQRNVSSVGLNELDNIVNQSIDRIGRVNPNFHQLYRSGNDALSAIHRSNVIENFISKHTHPFTSKAAQILFSGGATGSAVAHGAGHLASSVAQTAGLATAAYPIYQAGKVIYRMMRSPELLRHYIQTINSAAKNQIGPYKKHLEKLDEGLKEMEEKGEFQ